MASDTSAAFDKGAEAWAEYNQRPLGRIRLEVTWHNLARHLPGPAGPERQVRVLDAGGGSGELALRLVGRGYAVWLLDSAPAMLEQARRAAEALPADQRLLLTLCPIPVGEAPAAFAAGFFDAITCHTLIEYLPEPRDALAALAGLLRAGGLLSVSFVNRHAEVLRQLRSGANPADVRAVLEAGSFCARLFDQPGRAYTTDEVGAWLVDLGFTVAERCGIRAFADWVPDERLGELATFEALLELELAVATLSPYRELARYSQILARKEPRAQADEGLEPD